MSRDASDPNEVQVAPGRPFEGSSTPAAVASLPSTAQVAPNQPSPGSATPSAPAAQGKAEHRKSPRRRALKEGKVIFGKSQSVIDVTIDNVSEGGAHIRMLSSHGLPGEFYLAEASRGVIHRAEVAWRTATGMGLRLLGPLEDVAAREAFLRKFKRN
jgi:hypothetical protein